MVGGRSGKDRAGCENEIRRVEEMINHVGASPPSGLRGLGWLESRCGELRDEVFLRGAVEISAQDGRAGTFAEDALDRIALFPVEFAGSAQHEVGLEVGVEKAEGATGQSGPSFKQEAFRGATVSAAEGKPQICRREHSGHHIGEREAAENGEPETEWELVGIHRRVSEAAVVSGEAFLETLVVWGRGDLASAIVAFLDLLEEQNIAVGLAEKLQGAFKVGAGGVRGGIIPRLPVLDVESED